MLSLHHQSWTTTKRYESINYSKRLTDCTPGCTTAEQTVSHWNRIKSVFAYQSNLYNVHTYNLIIKLQSKQPKTSVFQSYNAESSDVMQEQWLQQAVTIWRWGRPARSSGQCRPSSEGGRQTNPPPPPFEEINQSRRPRSVNPELCHITEGPG